VFLGACLCVYKCGIVTCDMNVYACVLDTDIELSIWVRGAAQFTNDQKPDHVPHKRGRPRDSSHA
jgi:hypothetical protein